MKQIAFVFALLLMSAPLFAGDLINRDSVKYDIEISSGGSTTHTSINGNTTQNGGAKKGCTIKIVGGSSINVDFDGDVIIQKGQIQKK